MFRLFALLLALPWPVMAVIAAGLFWAAQDSHRSGLAFEAEKAAALRAEVPAPVALDVFTMADVHAADEVHVTAWVNLEHNYQLTKERKGTDTVRRMFVLFGPGDAVDSTVARGIVLLPPEQVDGFIDLVATHLADPVDPRFPFHLNGQRDASPELSSMVSEAFAERGLTKAPDFLVVTPYLEGRSAALAPDPEAGLQAAMVWGVLGGIAVLLALRRLLSGGTRRRGPVVPQITEADRARMLASAARPVIIPEAAGPVGQGYGTLPTPGTNTWSPLAVVQAKQAQMGLPGVMERGPVAQSGAKTGPASVLSRLVSAGGVMRKLTLALGLYLLVYTGFNGLTVGQMGQMTPEMAAMMDVAGLPPEDATGAGPAAPMPQGISGADQQPLPQIGDKPPSETDQVSADIAAGMPPADAVLKAITAEHAGKEATGGPVFVAAAEAEPAAKGGVMQRLFALLPQGVVGMDPGAVVAAGMGGDLWQGPVGIAVLLALGSAFAVGAVALARRSRQRATALRSDPWARISDRLQ